MSPLNRALLRLASFATALASAVLSATPLSAAVLTWTNVNGNSWNVDTLSWRTSMRWTNSSTAGALFDDTTTPGSITISESIANNPVVEVNNVTVNASGYTLAPGSGHLTFAGSTPTVSVAPNQSLTISAPLYGTDGLTFTGSGTTVLSGASTYTGGTNVVFSNVIANVDDAIPLGAVAVGLGSTLDLHGTNQSFTQLTLEGNLKVGSSLDDANNPIPGTGQLNITSITGAGNLYLAHGGFLTATINAGFANFAGNINPLTTDTDGTLLKEGSGALALTGTSTLTGAFSSAAYYVDQGTLIGTTNSINHRVFVNTDATLSFQQSTDAAFNGVLTGPGHIQILENAGTPITFTYDNDNTNTGDTSVFSNITLAVTDDNQLGTLITQTVTTIDGLPTLVTVTSYASLIFQGGTLRTLNPIASQRNLQISSAGGTIDTNLQSSNFSGSITELTTLVNGVLTPSTGPLNIIGGGTATFSRPAIPFAPSSFDSLIINNAAVIFDHNNITLSNPDTSLVVTLGSFTLQNAAILSTSGASIGGISGGAAVVLDGASTTWTASGTVNVATDIGTGSLTLQNAAHATMPTLKLSNGFRTAATLAITSGASLDTQNAFIGSTNGQGSASVSGTGSVWNVDQDLTLANNAVPEFAVASSLAIADHASVAVIGKTTLATAAKITVNAATFTTGALASLDNSTTIAIADAAANSPALVLGSNTAPNLAYSGVISNFQNTPGSVLKVGTNTQTLAANNTYTGSTTSSGGNLILSGSSLSSSFTANNTATLTLSALNLNLAFNTITANAGGAVVYTAGTAITGGFLFGPGTHSFNTASLTGTQLFNGAPINVNAATFTAVNSAAAISVAGFTTGLTWNGGANAGSLTLQSFATANLASFTSSGVIAVGSLANLNINSADLILSGGSRTSIAGGPGPLVNGIPTTIFPGHLNLTANNVLQLNGGLLTNNGTITGPTYVNFAGVAKGSGTYGQVFLTDGGTFAPGNSPGNAATADTTWGAAASYQWQLADAAGTPGSGFDHWSINGALTISAGTTSNSKFLIDLETLDPSDNPDLAANFDPTHPYSWEILSATTGINNFNPADFTLNTANFQNPTAGGTFSLSSTPTTLLLNFTPATPTPEPTSVALLTLPLLLLTKRRKK